jgi:23S rRNA pseudouridine1911/1915/1917 synthase
MNNDSKITHHTLTIPDMYASERLDQVLAKLLPTYSRTQIQEWIVSGSILVNGQTAKTKTKLKGGETVSVEACLKAQPQWAAQAIPLNIEYEDEALIIINKPAGLVVHPGAGNADRTLLNALLHHAPDLQALPRAGIIHRLDKETSGLLVVAKTAAAFKDINLQLKKRTLLREYQAIVYGAMISGGTVDAPLDRHPLQRKRRAVIETGKPAITHYRIAEKFVSHTRLKLQLETGRTHQIRVHMAHIRHPIIGDPVYGGRIQLSKGMTPELKQAIKEYKRQALHAFALGLSHPETHEFMRWEIALPDDMQHLLEVLRQDLAQNLARSR